MNSLKMIELSLTDVVIRMALAVVFGALIGLERSIKRKGFGISSNAILCLASCTISILQIQSVDILVDVVKQNSALASIISMDITRYGAQVISGVGFLGAGIIVFRERKVSGLTTAVMMWNVTIIGLVIGMGFLTIAFINLMATLLVLALAHFKRKTPLKRGALSRIDFGIRTRGSDSKDFLCRQRRFLAFQLAPSLKRKRARSICLCHGNNLTIK